MIIDVLPESSRFVAFFPPKLFAKRSRVLRVVGVVRTSIVVVLVISALAGSLGAAAAQSYPPPNSPPPGDYYAPPPDAYPPPRPYFAAPVPPLDVGTGEEYPPGHYAPASRPYYPRPDRAALQAPPPYEGVPRPPAGITGDPDSPEYTGTLRAPAVAGLPAEDQPEGGPARELAPQFHRQLVDYVTPEPAGTVIIDTPHTFLYLVLGGGKAVRYGVGVGREGFTWAGTERISRMSEWPDWHPPKEMIERQPYLPRFMAGGEGNPLGARALYLGNTVYRIHGTNQPSTIGHFVSSGCIRLTNEDIADLYSRVNLGTRVVVLPGSPPVSASAQNPVAR
jgi:lipoprotein-anchoring transpeptidase ErfK/SrfK